VYAGDGLAGLLDTYGRASDSLDEVDVTLELLPEGADKPVAAAKGVLEPLQRVGENISRRARFELPLNAVATGEYVARAKVRASGETVAESVRQVEVVAGTAFADATAPAPFRAQDVLSGEVVRRHVDRLKRNPDAPVAQYALRGIDLFGREAFSEAAEALRQALLLDETSATTAFVLGWAYEGAGDTRKAIGAWRAAAVADPKLVAAHLALADAYVRLAAPALAVQALRAGLAALPDSPELKSRLATIEGRMEDPW
jgi:tetratricopeptide (TPR) repeat protein